MRDFDFIETCKYRHPADDRQVSYFVAFADNLASCFPSNHPLEDLESKITRKKLVIPVPWD